MNLPRITEPYALNWVQELLRVTAKPDVLWSPAERLTCTEYELQLPPMVSILTIHDDGLCELFLVVEGVRNRIAINREQPGPPVLVLPSLEELAYKVRARVEAWLFDFRRTASSVISESTTVREEDEAEYLSSILVQAVDLIQKTM